MELLNSRPADQLEGLQLDGGWKVGARALRPPEATGGGSSTCYFVEKPDGTKGYLKAIDFVHMITAPDPAARMQELLSLFLFERDLCKKCSDASLDHVVVSIDTGKVLADATKPQSLVQYIIFELADCDIRHHIAMAARNIDYAWRLRALHHMAIALQQLHGIGIAHRDVKPSNVLVFSGQRSKLADLGNAALRGGRSPCDEQLTPGTPAYAPPEWRYGYQVAMKEWNDRNLGIDLYTLGSMIVFMLSDTTMSGLLFANLDTAHHPGTWEGMYADVLPHLYRAFGLALQMVGPHIPAEDRSELMDMVRYLCDPDPAKRGHPEEIGPALNRYSLRRFVARLNALATKAESNRTER